jgi:hypothetical protein
MEMSRRCFKGLAGLAAADDVPMILDFKIDRWPRLRRSSCVILYWGTFYGWVRCIMGLSCGAVFTATSVLMSNCNEASDFMAAIAIVWWRASVLFSFPNKPKRAKGIVRRSYVGIGRKDVNCQFGLACVDSRLSCGFGSLWFVLPALTKMLPPCR